MLAGTAHTLPVTMPPGARERAPRRPSAGLAARAPGDGVRLVLAMGLLAMAAWSASTATHSAVEVDVFRAVNDLPGAFAAPLVGVMQLGALGAVPAFAAIAVVARRRHLARLVVVAGASAWVAAKVIGHLVDEDGPARVLHGIRLHGVVTPGLAFPATHVAIAAALATVAAPYLARPNRRLAWAGVFAVGVARIYVGAHFPIDVVGGVALGWATGSLIHLVVGAPRGLPPVEVVTRALRAGGVAVAAASRTDSPDPGVGRYEVTTAAGDRVLVRAVSRDRPEADWLYRAWRFIAYREPDDEHAITSPAHLVDHEAHVLLAAERAGLGVPHLVTTRPLGEGWSMVATTSIDGVPLLDAAVVDEHVLDAAWIQVERLHALGIAHGSLRAEHVFVGPGGDVHVGEFGAARVAASDDDRRADIAELCASLSEVLPPARVATSAVRVLGAECLAAVLPFLQPLRLTPITRRRLAAHPGLLERVRTEVAAAAGCEAPPVAAPARVAARNLVPLAGALFAINLLLPQVAQAHETAAALRHTRWMWLVAAVALSAFTYLMAAVALLGAVGRRLALGRTWAVQLAAAFTNRLAPAGLGGMATNVRYLEAAGTPRHAAVAALGLDSAAGFVVHALGLVVVVPLLGSSAPGALHFSTAELPERWPALVAVIGVLVVVGGIVRALRLHRRLVAPVRAGAVALRAALTRPAGAAALFGGSVGVTAGYALALVAATRAFGLPTGVAAIVAVYLGGSAIAAVAPTPGGLGALEAALVAGLTAAGAAAGPAVAAVLAYRLVTFWLPIVPGFVAYRALRRSAVL